MALVIALALMTGLQGELRDRILGSQAHVYVWKTGGITDYRAGGGSKLRQVPGVVGAAPTIFGKALWSPPASAGLHQREGDRPALEPSVTAIRTRCTQGASTALAQRERGRAARHSDRRRTSRQQLRVTARRLGHPRHAAGDAVTDGA